MKNDHLKGGQGRYEDPDECTELVECMVFAVLVAAIVCAVCIGIMA